MDNLQVEQQQLQDKYTVRSEISENTRYMATKKPLQDDEFERLPDYVQQLLISSEQHELQVPSKEELKDIVDQYFGEKK